MRPTGRSIDFEGDPGGLKSQRGFARVERRDSHLSRGGMAILFQAIYDSPAGVALLISYAVFGSSRGHGAKDRYAWQSAVHQRGGAIVRDINRTNKSA